MEMLANFPKVLYHGEILMQTCVGCEADEAIVDPAGRDFDDLKAHHIIRPPIIQHERAFRVNVTSLSVPMLQGLLQQHCFVNFIYPVVRRYCCGWSRGALSNDR
eukprot:6474822-Amphidinium_carterae.1